MTLHLFPFVLLFHILTELYINIQTYSDLTIDILKFMHYIIKNLNIKN